MRAGRCPQCLRMRVLVTVRDVLVCRTHGCGSRIRPRGTVQVLDR